MKKIILKKDLNLFSEAVERGSKAELLNIQSIQSNVNGKIEMKLRYCISIPSIGYGVFNEHEFKEYFEFAKEEKGNEIENKKVVIEENLKIIRNGKATIVILEDGTKGVSKCLEEDTYNESIGFEIAYKKAKIKQLNKELKKLSR